MFVFTISPQLPCIHAIGKPIIIVHILLLRQHLIEPDKFTEQTTRFIRGNGHARRITPLQFPMLELLTRSCELTSKLVYYRVSKKRKTPLRGVIRCQACLWYVGRQMLHHPSEESERDEGECPICGDTVEGWRK